MISPTLILRSMDITGVTIFPFNLRGVGSNVRAYAEVTFDDALAIRGLRVIETRAGGLFISYPSQKSGTGEFRDLVVPLTKEMKASIRQAVLERYRASLPDAEAAPPSPAHEPRSTSQKTDEETTPPPDDPTSSEPI